MVTNYYSTRIKCLNNKYLFLILTHDDIKNDPNVFYYLNLYKNYLFLFCNKIIKSFLNFQMFHYTLM